VILPKGTRLLGAIRTLLDKRITKPLDFEEVALPKIAPVSTFEKAGILGRWDDYLLSVKPFSNTNGVTDEYLMDPLQCIALYQFFENRSLDAKDLPIRWFDSSGPTYRNEDSDKIIPLVKQREFHRAEFMYVGTKTQVIYIREECLARLEQLCIDLELKYRIVVGAGCYQTKKGEFETPESLREIPIKDLEIVCPGHGNRNGEQYLEVVGSSILGKILTSRFNITGTDGSGLWSGCTGIGLERMMFALITNYGTNFEEFPEMITKVMT
jgi:seryl-tRNA synthetase